MISILLVLVGCGEGNQRAIPPSSAEKMVLKRILIKEEFGKGIFLSTTRGMVYGQSHLYIPDQSANRVLKLDDTLEPLLSIGTAGEGPGELSGPGFLFVGQDRIFIDMGGTQRISSFDTSGTFIEATPLGEYKHMSRFAALDSTVFLSSPNKDKPFSVVDTEGNFLYSFGTFRFADIPRFRISRNLNHVFMTDLDDQPALVAVGLSEPEINIFDVEGKLLVVHDYRSLPQTQQRLEEVEQFYVTSAPNQMPALIADACSFGNQLYIMISASSAPFVILHFELSLSAVKYKDTLLIQDDLFPISMATNGQRFFILDGRTNFLFVYQANLI